jgi:hypothetical protein
MENKTTVTKLEAALKTAFIARKFYALIDEARDKYGFYLESFSELESRLAEMIEILSPNYSAYLDLRGFMLGHDGEDDVLRVRKIVEGAGDDVALTGEQVAELFDVLDVVAYVEMDLLRLRSDREGAGPIADVAREMLGVLKLLAAVPAKAAGDGGGTLDEELDELLRKELGYEKGPLFPAV